jgi:Ser/Thr protein kinase RdoA (MazF antagonist)
VIDGVMITDDELISILNKYSFGELSSSIEQITDGWTNLTYKFQVKSNEKNFILREYLPSTQRIILLEEIQCELSFISYLFKQYDLPVVPLIDPPGIFVLNNGHYCAIFPFIDGIKYLNTPQKPLRELWQIIEISRFIGRMHSINKPNHFPECNRRTINLPDTKYQLVNSCGDFEKSFPDLYKRIRKIIDEKTNLIPVIKDELEQIIFEKNLEQNLPKGFIHVDIHDDNVLFHRNQNKIAAVLDFDDMSFGPFLIDIAMSLCFWCVSGSELNTDYVKVYLIEYQNARTMLLTDDEWNLLELYCYMTMFHQILFTIEVRDNGIVNDAMFNELLLPIEKISQDKMFLKKIR